MVKKDWDKKPPKFNVFGDDTNDRRRHNEDVTFNPKEPYEVAYRKYRKPKLSSIRVHGYKAHRNGKVVVVAKYIRKKPGRR